MQGFRWLIVVSALAMVQTPALAFDGDLANGKRVFMLKGQAEGNKACMTCHPRGETTGKMPNGKKIPSLTEEELSQKKLKSKSDKFLKRMKLELNDKDTNDLYAFVESLPSKGFGPVPAEWEEYVKNKLAK